MTRAKATAAMTRPQTPNPIERADMRRRNCKTLPKRMALASAVAAACFGMGLAAAQETAVRGRMLDHAAADPRAVEIDGARRLPRSSERELPKATFVLGDERAVPAAPAASPVAAPVERSDASTPHFDSGADALSPADRAQLDRIAEQVKGRDGLRFEIVGHTDTQALSAKSRERFADNHALGLARAQQAARHLTQRLGLPETAAAASSRGPDAPVATPASDPANWAANRRVEVRVYWRDAPVAAAPVAAPADPGVCRTFTAFGTDDAPLRLSVDGQLLSPDGRQPSADGTTSADRQRCVDVQLERNQLRLQYDNLSQPRRLSASAWPTTVVAGDTVRFAGYSNYLLFTSKAELRVYTANEAMQRRQVATVPLDAGLRGEWQVPEGLLDRLPESASGKLYYRVRVYDRQGRFDETDDLSLTLVKRHKPETGTPPDPARELLRGYGQNNIAIANIPLSAGTVTASGAAIRPGESVRALGFAVPVDESGRFVFQQLVPRRVQTGEIAVTDAQGATRVYRRDFDLPTSDWFFVGQADLTVGSNSVSGPAAIMTNDKNRYGGGGWSEGRIAGYAKGQLNDRWTLTASVDTEERPLKELFRNLDRKDPTSLFRRFDPEDSWSTFGDDSTTVEDAPTQGRFYLRVDDGRSQAMWGNFKLNFGDTELTRVSRGLYGFHGRYLGEESTSFGEARLKVDAFAAEPGTLAAREEFRGTGGSLYYLRNQDITRGAERVTLEIRDRDSGLVLKRTQLVPTTDYEIDYLQGRVLLSAPLPSLSDDGSLVRAGGFTGMPTYLVVDYEYTPLATSLDTLAVGGRVSWWANDNVGVGVTASRQDQIGGDQRLAGVDLTLRKTENTYLKGEFARSRGPGTTQLDSMDGGFSFTGRNGSLTNGPGNGLGNGPTGSANAWRLEGQADLGDFDIRGGGRVSAYAQSRDAGFSAPGQYASNATRQVGVQATVPFGEKAENGELRLKADRRDEQNGYNSSVLDAQYSLALSPEWKLGLGLRYDDKTGDALITSPSLPTTQAVSGERADAAVQLEYTGADRWSAYGFAQKTLRRTGTRLENDRLGFGGRYRVNDKLALRGELSTGDGGFAGKAGVDYQYDDRSSVYMTYVSDTGRTDENLIGRGGSLVTGVRSRVGDGLTLFTEHRQATGAQPGLTHAYGVQYAPDTHWTFGVNFENGWVGAETLGATRRQAVAFTSGYSSERLKYSGGLEYRKDRTTAETRTSWLVKNSFSWKVDDDSRWIGKFNWADSDSTTGTLAAAKYTEAMLGYALRPALNDRLNLLFKYTYLYDLSSPGQVVSGGVDSTLGTVSTTGIDYQQRSHVFAIDATWDLSERWTLGGKYAWRRGELRASRDSSAPWFKSSAELAVLRVDWKLVRNWDWMLEWRTLRARELKDRKSGWVTAAYYHVNENLKVGIGYNFTDYSDNLTDMSYRSKGWFLNVLGKF
ncbi:outer membrane protein OmpA-like peptidoglycan-associated protein [Variovorax paradoxus]|uniref:OmpA family protein n=1 Tax=Variovorax atrisoli TaxID=3394203 RepID=UPI00119C7A06|nr:OmpA family protein [Variovorax paradoxus]MDR6522347.1 outer membrane protein OmpA-like peptidoglycan-associated protein [Variovorax paradoxus]